MMVKECWYCERRSTIPSNDQDVLLWKVSEVQSQNSNFERKLIDVTDEEVVARDR